MSKPLRAAWLLCVWLAGCTGVAFAAAPLQGLKGPPGFHVSVFSDQVPNAREMMLGTHDTVFGGLGEGKVYALTGMQDGCAAHVHVIAKDLQMPIKGRSCSEFAQTALRLGAHVAPPGRRFYAGRMFPAVYHDAIFIAEQGSWNRSRKPGYRVLVVHERKDGKVGGSQPFLTGFLDGQKILGRPADVQPLRDGSLLVSDDDNGVIYRITQKAK